MLKITVEKTGRPVRVKLDGSLSGPWVAELEKSWVGLGSGGRKGWLVVDLIDVTHVDAQGRELLRRMHRGGAELIGCGLMTREIIQQIQLASQGCEPEKS